MWVQSFSFVGTDLYDNIVGRGARNHTILINRDSAIAS